MSWIDYPTNEDWLGMLEDVELGVFLYIEQCKHNIKSPVMWTEWLRKENNYMPIKLIKSKYTLLHKM